MLQDVSRIASMKTAYMVSECCCIALPTLVVRSAERASRQSTLMIYLSTCGPSTACGGRDATATHI